MSVLSASVPIGADVEVDVVLSAYPGGVMATGTVFAPWRGECRRCGRSIDGRLEIPIRERFVPERAWAEVDDDVYPFHDDVLDLEPLARDAVLLDLPLAPLCTPGCLGLCPLCGIDRNAERCRCASPPDPRWSGLDSLKALEPGRGGLEDTPPEL